MSGQARLRRDRFKLLHSTPRQRMVPTWRLYVLVAIVGWVILASHRPDAVLNAQFWTEDGTMWYPQAYTEGAGSILKPYNGYFHTVPRLVALAAQAVPLGWAPLVFAAVALSIQVLPALLLLSPRLEPLIPHLSMRLVFVFLYFFFPNSHEVHANLTNSQTFLALAAFLIVLAEPARQWWGQVRDMAIVGLSSLTGPFSILLLPIAGLRAWQAKEWRAYSPLLGVLTIGAAIQGASIVWTRFTWPEEVVGMPLLLMAEVFARQVLLGGLFGIEGFAMLDRSPHLLAVFVGLVSLLAALLAGYTLVRGPATLRLVVLFAGLLFVAGILSPTDPGLARQTGADLLEVGVNNRYFFLPSLLFMLLVFATLSRPVRSAMRMVAVFFLVMFLGYGVRLDWHHPPFTDFQFQKQAQLVAEAPAGSQVVIPINPPGWFMEFRK